jgi:hypothetical protein
VGSDYDHAFCAFETENPKTGKGELMVPNIVGVSGSEMVQWISLTEYLFGIVTKRGRHYAQLSELAHVRGSAPKGTITARAEQRTPKLLVA